MDALQFAYWLQGFAELSGDTPPTEAQWKAIRDHVALVFEKVTPRQIPAQMANPYIGWPTPGSAGDMPQYARTTVRC